MSTSNLDVIWRKKFTRLPSQIALTQDGARAAVAFPSHAVMLMGPEGRVLWERDLGVEALSVALTGDERHIIACSPQDAFVLDIDGNEVRRLDESASAAMLSTDTRFAFLAWSDPTKKVASLSFYDGEKKGFLQRRKGAVVWKHKFEEPFGFFAASQDCSRAVVGFARHILCVDNRDAVIFDHKTTSTVKGMAVNSDASIVAFSTFDGHVLVLDGSGDIKLTAQLDEELAAVACDSGCNWLLVASKSKHALFLVDRAGQLVWRFGTPHRPIYIDASGDMSSFAVCCADYEMLLCRNYYADPKKRVHHALRQINDKEYTQLSLNVLAQPSGDGAAALVNAIKDGTIPQTIYKMIGKYPDEVLIHLTKAIVSDGNPGLLFQCLAVFYERALPLLLDQVRNLAEQDRRDFFLRLAASAASTQDVRLFDLLGLLHLGLGELEAAEKHLFEAVRLPDSPDAVADHLREVLQAMEVRKSTQCIDQLFTETTSA